MKTKFKMPDRMYLPPNMGHIAHSIPGAHADNNGMIIVPVDATDAKLVARICAASIYGALALLEKGNKIHS